MGYSSVRQVVQAANDLVYGPDGIVTRTRGFWHVLIFLRARRLHENANQLELNAFALTEAAFDLNGIALPTSVEARNVYFEPGASQGEPHAMFRQREGPRQTFLDRIQRGFDGRSHFQPNLFQKTGQSLPILVSLQPDWIDTLRSIASQQSLLDERTASLLTWMFRFGVPVENGQTVSIGVHQGQGVLVRRPGLQLLPLPGGQRELIATLMDFLGLSGEQVLQLMPEISHVDTAVWTEPQSIELDQLQAALFGHFSTPENRNTLARGIEVPEQVEAVPQPAQGVGPMHYEVNWDRLLSVLMAEPPLIGVEEVIVQIIAALRAGKFVILLGVPGTGKTELAKAVCDAAADLGAPGFSIATATAEWTTFETIGGYMPATDGSGRLEFVENVFTECVRTGNWLIIDELNRADIDKAFGELFTLFSKTKVRLAYRRDNKPIVLVPSGSSVDVASESPIYVAADWRMIGTMNTFDKASLFQLSYAFMRRFAFIEVPIPEQQQFAALLTQRVAAELPIAHLGDGVVTETLRLIQAVFAPRRREGLDALGLLVGPAIPLDIIKFLHQKYQIDSVRNRHIVVRSSLLQALEMYLYPQFEGRDTQHAEIVSTISQSLALSSEERRSTSRVLATWTGSMDEESGL